MTGVRGLAAAWGQCLQGPWAVLVIASGAVLEVAAGDYRWLFDGVSGGDGPGEADVLRVGPGQGRGGEGPGPGGKAPARGWEGVPDLLG